MEKIALLMMMMMMMWKSFFLPHVHSMMLFNLSFFLVSFHFHLFFFSSSDTSNKIFIGNKQTKKKNKNGHIIFIGLLIFRKKKFWIFSWILGVQVYNKCMCFYFEMWMNLFFFVIISNYNSFKLDEQNFQWFCLDEILFHNLSPSLLLFDYNMASCLI